MAAKRYALFLALVFSIGAFAQKQSVSLADVWRSYRFYAPGTQGLRSMADGEHFTTLEQSSEGVIIPRYSYEKFEAVDTLVTAAAIAEHSGVNLAVDGYQLGPDENRLLLRTATESIYRHSSKSNYYIYDLESRDLDSLRTEGKQRLAEFSPTENKVAYVYDRHLHIVDLDNDHATVHLGKGEPGAFIAGGVDWVYEEEFSFHKGYQWSPEGRYIAYYQFDEREVPTFSMDKYGQGLYPTQEVFKYPKAGEVNSIVQIHVYDLQEEKDYAIDIPEDYEYIPRIKWTQEDDELVIYTMNRHQNSLNLWEVEMERDGVEVEKLYREEAPAYLEINDDLRFLSDESFIWSSEKDGYQHLYHFDEDGELIRQLTSGKWEVTKFYGIDKDEEWLYFQAAKESPLRREVYRVQLDGGDPEELSAAKGWNEAQFSEGMRYFLLRHSAAGKAPRETLHSSDGTELQVVRSGEDLEDRLDKYQLSNKEFFSVPNGQGTELNGWMIKPNDFRSDKEYPLLMFTYGGPGSQTVKDQYDGFNTKWYQLLADSGYVVVSIDNRGTGARGRDFRTQTYQELGRYEIEDQIAAAEYLGGMNFIDAERIGMWGWSYGGYMSSLALTKGADQFKMAIAVAPVTNWRFYDNIYTERYMRTPQENPRGYDENSPINHVDKMKGKYLLVHGSADDNVHLQNTMRMISALVAADKQFEQFIYPDKDHGIGGGNTRYHLYSKMTDFIFENL